VNDIASELEIDEEHVRQERRGGVRAGAHWLYLVVVLGGSVLLMLAFIALLDATT
jgi:hypothetical protein